MLKNLASLHANDDFNLMHMTTYKRSLRLAQHQALLIRWALIWPGLARHNCPYQTSHRTRTEPLRTIRLASLKLGTTVCAQYPLTAMQAHLADGVPLPVGEADLRPLLAHERVGLLRAHAHFAHQVANDQRRAAAAPGLAVYIRHLPRRRLLCATRSGASEPCQIR